MSKLYKITDVDGSAYHGGEEGAWPLPTGGEPGAWLKVKGEIVPCRRGRADARRFALSTAGVILALCGALALLLGGCNSGLEAHDHDLLPGPARTVRVAVTLAPFPAAREACGRLLPGTDAMGCATWREDGDDARRDASVAGETVVPAGFDCAVTVVPNAELLLHELMHCSRRSTLGEPWSRRHER